MLNNLFKNVPKDYPFVIAKTPEEAVELAIKLAKNKLKQKII